MEVNDLYLQSLLGFEYLRNYILDAGYLDSVVEHRLEVPDNDI